MANPKIKFSHAYNKLKESDGKPVKTAKLLLCLAVQNDQIKTMKDFIAYDTDNGTYKIPYATWYLLLVFQKPNGDLFTTVRPMWSSIGNKKPYYDSLVGQTFDVIINEQGYWQPELKEVQHG